MKPKDFQKLLERDNYTCQHCGLNDDTLVPQHRKNKGHGGSKLLDTPSNLVVVCSRFNGLMESSAPHAEFARKMGLKLSSWENPIEVPIYFGGQYFLLLDDWTKVAIPHYN